MQSKTYFLVGVLERLLRLLNTGLPHTIDFAVSLIQPETKMDVAEEDNAQLKKRQAIQVIMSDTSLSPQEKQKKIQEFMTSGSQVTAPIPPSATQYSAAPTPDVVRDAVTLGHRQPGVTAAAGNPRPPPATTASAPTRQSPEVGAIQSSGMDPASRKGSRVSSNREASTPGAIRSESNKADQISTRIGAVSSLADHAAARKGGRVPSSMSVSAAADAVSIEPDALAPPSIGAVSSSGEDPATRKGARGTPRTSVRASVTGSINSADAQSVGASSAGHHEDPATRKTVRASRTPMQFTGSSLSRAGSGKTKEISDSEAERMPNSGIPAAAAAAAPIYDESRQMKEIGELESEYVSKSPVAVPPSSLPIPMATLPTVPPSHTTAAADGRTMIPVQEEHQDQYEQSNSLPSPAQQPETYAGVGLVGPDVAGADTGGIQVRLLCGIIIV